MQVFLFNYLFLYLISYIRSDVVTKIVYHDVTIESPKQRMIVHTMHTL